MNNLSLLFYLMTLGLVLNNNSNELDISPKTYLMILLNRFEILGQVQDVQSEIEANVNQDKDKGQKEQSAIRSSQPRPLTDSTYESDNIILDIIFEDLLWLYGDNKVTVKIKEPFNGRVYMHVTSICEKDGEFACKRKESNNPDYSQNFADTIIKELSKSDQGNYEGSYSSLHNMEGYVSISIYAIESKLKEYCYPNINSNGSYTDIKLVETMSHNWKYGVTCGNRTDMVSVLWKGRLLIGTAGDYTFQLDVNNIDQTYTDSNMILNINFTREVEISGEIILSESDYNILQNFTEHDDSTQAILKWKSPEVSNKSKTIDSNNVGHVKSRSFRGRLSIECGLGGGHQPNESGCQTFPAGTFRNMPRIASRCGEGHEFIEGKGCQPCPEGKYKLDVSENCVDCSPMTYSDIKGAHVCKNCPEGTYSSEGSSSCTPCYPLCENCFGPLKSQCSSCIKSNSVEINNNGICVCSRGSYYSDSDSSCTPCHPLCLSCSGPSPNKCNECDTSKGYSVQGKDNYCVYNCEDGYYRDGTICKRILYSIIP